MLPNDEVRLVPLTNEEISAEQIRRERKEWILNNYPSNLSEIQLVGFDKEFITSTRREDEKFLVRPDCHFRDENGLEYFVFYNNRITQLRDLLYKKFKDELSKHSFLLHTISNSLSRVANTSIDNVNNKKFFKVSAGDLAKSAFSGYFAFGTGIAMRSKKYKPIVNIVGALSTTCGHLKYAYETYGTDLDNNTDKVCVFIVNKNVNGFCPVFLCEDYCTCEKEINSIINSSHTDKEIIDSLDDLLENYKEGIRPSTSILRSVRFCFPLNRVSYYLSNFERSLQDKDLETLEAMYKLRKKVNRLTLEHRFIFTQNEAPILDVPINRCKLIVDSKSQTMVFLERAEVKRFQKDIEIELDRKASNVTFKYELGRLTGPQLREIVNRLKPKSYSLMIDKMSSQIIEMEAMKKQERRRAITYGVKGGVQIIGNFTNLVLTALADNGNKSNEFSIDDINDYLDTEKRNKEQGEFVLSLNEYLMDSNFDLAKENDADISVDKIPFVPDSPKNVIDTGFNDDDKIVMRKKPENLTKLGQALKQSLLTSSDIDQLSESFKHFIEASRINAQIELLRKQRRYIEVIHEKNLELINLFKLYIELVKCDFMGRENFSGALITEERKEEVRAENTEIAKRLVLLREYKAKEIKKLEDEI